MAKFNRQVSYFAIALCVLGVALIAFRHFVSGIPFLPGASQTLWAVEAKIQFEADKGPISVSFTLPNEHAQFVQVNERTASPGFDLMFDEGPKARVAKWSINEAKGKQTLYYLTELKVAPNTAASPADRPTIEKPRFLGSTATAAGSVLSDANTASTHPFDIIEALIKAFQTPNQQAQLLLQKSTVSQRIVQLLMQADIPAREIDVLVLKDGGRQQPLRTWVQVFDGEAVRIFDPSGKYNPAKTPWVIWEQNDGGVIELMGGHGATVGFSMLQKRVPIVSELRKAQAQAEPGLLDASIHSLPLSEQALFKGILLVPVGVLIVVLMRTLVGLKTSGTFMPVLIALAFMQTSLATGLIGFALIVGMGLMIRSYFSRHNLLLVARISLVIISVVLIMALFSVVAFRFGLSEGLKLTLFPMIILSWTIERMSILWEEEGAKEVALQGGGSLFVALLGYMVMTNGLVQHLTFHFLGLQFIFMAIVLMCGSYTGYRLLELKRFRRFLAN
ncbi:inactive transglutaminase family protein [Marinagarivorans algicola]|uniref:inactive transglutaminase family protein n=1 Tax=Marinagarivorans algicola TaxID=1513270 RepID=UPI0006B9CDF1|nr:inactive transglutaminase family protein [Marinagarivorans algicola]